MRTRQEGNGMAPAERGGRPTIAKAMALLALAAALIPLMGAPAARAFELAFPVACSPGQDCVIQNYVAWGEDPTTDYVCGTQTYANHNGTDIRILDRTTMAQGVPVLASAAGTVKAVRDGVPDVDVSTIDREAVRNRECGNGVFIEHGDGWSTQYCHMKVGTVAVQSGQQVQAGTVLGQVGMSGLTQYPHLHLVVRKGDQIVDPFVGLAGRESCAAPAPGQGLWRDAVAERLAYRPVKLFRSGFSGQPVSQEGVNLDSRSSPIIPAASPVFLFWVRVISLRPEHIIHIEIKGPDGNVVLEHEADRVDRPKAQWITWAGRRGPLLGWPRGTYTGTVTIHDGQTVLAREARQVEIRG